MTHRQLRAALDQLELSQLKAAKLLRVDARTMRRWISGDTLVPEPVAIIFELLLASKINIADLQD
jgi:hypothetical protein